MDQVTWLEVLGRGREVTSRQRVDTGSIRIGRAYDNDVVLDDPHVAAHHLRLALDADGHWVAEDLGSINGLYVEGDRTRHTHVMLEGTTTLQVGHTGLRLRGARDGVAAELPLLRAVPRWPLAVVFVALVIGLELLGLWLGETGEPKLIRYLTPLLTLVAIVAVWTAAWSIVARVFGGHAQFGLHLLIASSGLLAYSLLDQLAELGAFALSWPALARGLYVLGWLLFAAVCFAHLRALGRSGLRVKGLVVAAVALLGITMQTLKLSEWRSTYGQASTLQRLEPPSLRIVGAQTESAFFSNSNALKAKLDDAREAEPEGGDGDGSGD